jgi:hypothetical protein
LAASGHDDLGAERSKFVGDSGTDTAGGAGNECDFILERSFHF